MSLDLNRLLGHRSSSHYQSSSIEPNMSGVNIRTVGQQLSIGVEKAHPTEWWSRSGYILSPLFDFMYLSISITVLTCVRVLSGVFKGSGCSFVWIMSVCVGLVDRTGRSRLFTHLKIVFMDRLLFFSSFFMFKLITPRTC